MQVNQISIDIFPQNKGKGYSGIGTEFGTFVPLENAYRYALERMKHDKELQKEFTEWFYSGNWVLEEETEAGYEIV